MRNRIANLIAAAQAEGLDPHNSDRIILWPLGRSGKAGTREDRTCDRCRTYVPKGDTFYPAIIQATLRMLAVGGLCTTCYAIEAVTDE